MLGDVFLSLEGSKSGNEDSLVGKKKRKVSSINLKKSNIKQKIKLNNKTQKQIINRRNEFQFFENKKSHNYLMKMFTFFFKKEINKKINVMSYN